MPDFPVLRSLEKSRSLDLGGRAAWGARGLRPTGHPALARLLTGRVIRFGDGGQTAALRISAARLAGGGRTLVLPIDPHPLEATCHPTLPDPRAQGGKSTPDRHLNYTLSGVEAVWESDQAGAPAA